jgi:site-specific recombinase XerD
VLGHSDIRTTQRYAQVDLEAMSRAHDRYSPVVALEALK